MSRDRFQMSFEARELYERLRALKVGEVATYAELSAVAGRDVQGDARPQLYTAMRAVRREDQMVIGTVTKVGVRRLSDVETVGSAETSRRKISRESRRAMERLSTVDYEALPSDVKRRHNSEFTVFKTTEFFSRPSGLARIEKQLGAKVDATKGGLPPAETFEMFSRKG